MYLCFDQTIKFRIRIRIRSSSSSSSSSSRTILVMRYYWRLQTYRIDF